MIEVQLVKVSEMTLYKASRLETPETEAKDVVFLTDARSVLEAIISDKLPDVVASLNRLKWTRRIVLQWIPSHCGVDGNEKADKLAKQGATAEQPDMPVTYKEKKTIIKNIRKKPPAPRDDYHSLNRQQQVIIWRLRTGHNRLKYHLYHKMKIGTSGGCECGSPKQDAEHILQHCSRLDTARKKCWATDTSLDTKLYGQLSELTKTSDFIIESNLVV